MWTSSWRSTVNIIVTFLLVCTISLAQDAREVARRVFPSVVLLEMYDSEGHLRVQASGFFVRQDIIVTNYHVIEGTSKGYAKIIGREEVFSVDGVVGADTRRDLGHMKDDAAAFIGTSFIQLKRADEAKKWFDQAISINSKNIPGHEGLGRVYVIWVIKKRQSSNTESLWS